MSSLLRERQQGRNGTMPRCCAGTECKHPEIGLPSGDGGIKLVPTVERRFMIHDLCSHRDKDAALNTMNVCPQNFCSTQQERLARDVIVIEGQESPSTRGGSVPRKKSNMLIQNEYLVVNGSFATVGYFRCRHCMDATCVWKARNASKARAHWNDAAARPLKPEL
jgi:hypothetical protein